jgi:hypothetical protein
MFPRDPPAPATRRRKSQWLWFADALEWIVENRRHQIKDTRRHFAIRLDPTSQIVLKVAGYCRVSIRRPGQLSKREEAKLWLLRLPSLTF